MSVRRDWVVLGGLLALCLAHGLWVTRGLVVPPDLDALRDIGFAQGVRDGNWWGDPAYAGAVRYYPPLVPALGAVVAWAMRSADLPSLWVQLGPWLGLLPVLMFFGLARAALAPGAAVVATAIFVLWNGAIAPPWVAGGYAPWLFAPVLSQAAFCAVAWLVVRLVPGGRWWAALLLGAAIGLTFLAHVIPALLLTAMLVAAAWVGQGLRWRMAGWLALAGAVQALVMGVYLLPLLLAYPGGVVHLPPGAWVADELRPNAAALLGLAAMNAPWLLAVALLRRRGWPAGMPGAMLAVWVAVCLAVLARHFDCAGAESGACTVLRMPVHHFHLYLQVAGALLIGQALSLRPLAPRALALLLLAGGVMLWGRPYDATARASAAPFDRAAYQWVLANTQPSDTVVTAGRTDRDGDFDPAAFAVMAAGRHLLAVNTLFSNPYLDWPAREAARQQALAWIAGAAGDGPCALARWAMLPEAVPVAAERAQLVAETPVDRIFRLRCAD